MNSGGDVLKRFFSLAALLLSITLFLLHGTSFSNAEIKNEATLTIVSEENALIAIAYGEDNNFTVTNNTAKAIDISNVEIVNETDRAIISVVERATTRIRPGESRQFTIPGDPNSLTGKVIQLIARWNGGNAKINSTIPVLIENITVEEVTEMDVNTVGPDIDEVENLIPEFDEEEIDPVLIEGVIKTEVDDE